MHDFSEVSCTNCKRLCLPRSLVQLNKMNKYLLASLEENMTLSSAIIHSLLSFSNHPPTPSAFFPSHSSTSESKEQICAHRQISASWWIWHLFWAWLPGKKVSKAAPEYTCWWCYPSYWFHPWCCWKISHVLHTPSHLHPCLAFKRKILQC